MKHSIEEAVRRLRVSFTQDNLRDDRWRRTQLHALRQLLRDNEPQIFAALKSDLGKSQTEAYVTEVALLHSEIRHALSNLSRWMRHRRLAPGLENLPARAQLFPQPVGLILIIAPWNYPLMLALGPLVSALAAGNSAVVKPSELTQATSALLSKLIPSYFSDDIVQVVEGGVAETTALLEQRFDHIFFTGSAGVGRVVMQAASKHLTPVTLELGGKSPCILTADTDIDVAARRIAWGKCLNAGQTCVAPDYLLALPGTSAPFKEAFKKHITAYFGSDPQQSLDFPRIVNDRHFERLRNLMPKANVTFGGQSDAKTRYIAPTLLEGLTPDAAALTEEIFGPILPIVEVDSLEGAVNHINARPKPLSLYAFTDDRASQRKIIDETRSGGVVLNDVVIQFAAKTLPFGGVGESGMGRGHGKAGFDTFSHMKPVLRKTLWGEIKLRYPPYSKRQERLLRWFFGD